MKKILYFILFIICFCSQRTVAQRTLSIINEPFIIRPVFGTRATTAVDTAILTLRMHDGAVAILGDANVNLTITPGSSPFGPMIITNTAVSPAHFRIPAAMWKDDGIYILKVPLRQTNRPAHLKRDEVYYISIATSVAGGGGSATSQTTGAEDYLEVRVSADYSEDQSNNASTENLQDGLITKKTPQVVHYDFRNGNLLMPKSMRFHPNVYRPFIVRIDNINRGAYKVEITAKDSTYSQSQPSDFLAALQQLAAAKPSQIVDTSKRSSNNSDENQKTTSKESAKNIGLAEKSVTDKKEAVKMAGEISADATVDALYSTNISSATIQEVQNNIVHNIPSRNAIPDALITRTPTNTTIKVANEKSGTAIPLDSFISAQSRFIQTETKRTFFQLRAIKQNLFKCSDAISTAIAAVGKMQSSLQDRFMTYAHYRALFNDEYALDSLERSLLLAKKLYGPVDGASSTLRALQEEARAAHIRDTIYNRYDDAEVATIVNLYKNMHVDSLLNILNSSRQSLRYLQTSEFYHFNSSPIFPFGDLIKVKVRITAMDSSDNKQPSDAKTYEIPLFTRYRIRFDFSTGIGITHGINDQMYKIEQRATISGQPDSATIVDAGSRQSVSPLIGGFLNTSIDIGSTMKPAITLGLSLNTSSLELTTILIGGSLCFGRDDRLVISAGGALKRVNTLRSDYEISRLYSTSTLGSDPSGVLSPAWHWGTFFALSYNLTGKASIK